MFRPIQVIMKHTRYCKRMWVVYYHNYRWRYEISALQLPSNLL